MGEAENKVGLCTDSMVDYWWACLSIRTSMDKAVPSILQTLVFVETKRKTDELTRRLRSQG